MPKIRFRSIYSTSDGKDFSTVQEAKRHERRLFVMNYLVDNQTYLKTKELGLTERQAELLIDLIADNVSKIYDKLEIDELV